MTPLIGFKFNELKDHEFPPRKTFLERAGKPILRSGTIMQIFAERGTGKTWFARSLAIALAAGLGVLSFLASKPVRVLYVDGEMASEEIQQNDRLLAGWLGVEDRLVRLQTVAADWQDEHIPRLDTPEGQEAIEPFIEKAEVIVLDNRSSLFNPAGERDPAIWAEAHTWLMSLRRRGKAVIIVHHTNRSGGARGISNAEDPMDVLINLSRPDDYNPSQGARFELSFDPEKGGKARGIWGDAVKPLTAHLTPDGWIIEPPKIGRKEQERRNRIIAALGGKQSITSFNGLMKVITGDRTAYGETWRAMESEGFITKSDGVYTVVA